MEKPEKFSTLAEAISAAAYIEQLLSAEHQWITNRLSWLFVSQSFCITAYTILSTSTGVRFGPWSINVLRIGLPVLGIVCCLTVGIAVVAAATVARGLANERARLGKQINELSPARIPLIGVDRGFRERSWTHWAGSMPHQLLPWVLGLFWASLLLAA